MLYRISIHNFFWAENSDANFINLALTPEFGFKHLSLNAVKNFKSQTSKMVKYIS